MARIERISEPWALNRSFAIAITMALAMILGSWAASGEIEYIVLLAVWFAAVMIIVFVRDYWWSPALIITAFSLSTSAMGIPLSGMELAVIIISLVFPVKIAMKTLRKAEPEMHPGVFYWALIAFVAVHAVVIIFYNKIEGTPILKNIAKAYYTALAPLVLYGLLIRYCHTRTVRPTIIALFITTFFVVCACICTALLGLGLDPLTSLHITVGWLDARGAPAILRISGPYLFIASLAFWPTSRGGFGRFVFILGILLGAFGTLVSGGRLCVALCIAAGLFFAFVRGKFWVAIPFIVVTVITSALITAQPDLLYKFPETVQRAVAPLNLSQEQTEVQQGLGVSDDWHHDLRVRSLDYWGEDTNSFWLGHGYKSWDPSINLNDPDGPIDQDHVEQLAIEMGLTENMFSSVTNIFGATGLLLYACFLGHVGWLLFKGCRRAPVGSDARALCEFSLINLLGAVTFAPFMGGVPALNLIFWQLGILAARPYLASPAPAKSPEPAATLPNFIPKSLRPVS